jgi:hypothetical protein
MMLTSQEVVIFFDKDFFPKYNFWGENAKVKEICKDYQLFDFQALRQADFSKIKTLVLPYGQRFPLAIHDGIKTLLASGGDLIVLGGATLEKPCVLADDGWRIYDPLQIGLWKEFFHSEWRNELGLSFHNVVKESQWYHGDLNLNVNDVFKPAFAATKLSWDCENYCGKLLPLNVGRTANVLSTIPEKSVAPTIVDFVTIVEPLHSRKITGRILSAGITPGSDWSVEDHRLFLNSLLASLELDTKNLLGMSLANTVLANESKLELDLWSRNTDCPQTVSVELLNAKGIQKTFSAKVDTINEFPLTGLDSGAYYLLIDSDVKYDFSILETDCGKLPDFSVSQANGYPVIKKNDEVIPAELYAFDPVDRHLDRIAADFPAHGVQITHFLCPLMLCWKGEDEYDWSSLDHMIERILRHAPSALLFPRILLQTPPWWDEANPDEVIRYRSGQNYVENETLADVGFHYGTQLPIYSKFNNGGLSKRIKQASYYSQKWRNDVAKAMKDLGQHVQEQVWKNNFLGIFFGAGTCGEWGNFSEKANQNWEDMSKPALNTFRNWLKKKYQNPADRVKAWEKLKDFAPEDVKLPESNYLIETDFIHGYFSEPGKLANMAKDISSAEIEKTLPPTFARRHVSRYGILKDPAQSCDAIEYFDWIRDSFPEMLIEITQGIKAAFSNKIIVGTFYGYLMQEYLQDLDGGAANLGFAKVLASSESPDLYVSPHYYVDRDLGTGDANIKNPTGSVRLSNKIFLDENDQRTILSERTNYLYYGGASEDTMIEAHEMSKRNFIARLSKNVGLWWYDLFGHGWYDHPEIMNSIEKTTEIYKKAITTPNPLSFKDSDNRLNIIYATDAYKYFCACSSFCSLNTHRHVQQNFNRNGFQWEAFLKSDMTKAPKAKAWFFMNALNISQEEREWIDKNLKCDGNILIWLYAPGIYRDDKMDLAYASELTGMKLAWDTESHLEDIELTNLNHPALSGLNGKTVKGFVQKADMPENSNINRISPEIYVEDAEAVTLGINPTNDRTTFAVRDFGTYKSVYIAAPIVPHKIMRSLLTWNDMQPTLDTADCLYGNGDLIGINAAEAGDKTITFSEDFELENLWDGGKLVSEDCQVKLNLKAKETFIGRIYKTKK